MAIQAFDNGADDALDALQSALLLANADFDNDDLAKENSMIISIMYLLVATIKARQKHAPTTSNTDEGRDRLLELIGGHNASAWLRVVTDCDVLYNEMYALFGSLDMQGILDTAMVDVYPALFGTNGPKGGPIQGSPNYTAAHIN